MQHIPRTLLDRINTKEGEHLLQTREIDELRGTIHLAIDNAAMVTARKGKFICGDDKNHECVEIKIVLRLQASE